MTRLRTLAILIVGLAAVAAGCGGSTSHPAPATVIKASQLALAKQHTVGFDVKLQLAVHGTLKSGGPAAALLAAPVSIDLRGHSATSGSSTRAAFGFTVVVVGGSFTGQVRAPGGDTAYIQLPSLLGPGWHSFPISSGAGGSAGGLAMSKLDPTSWLTNLHSSSKDGTDTISAGLDVAQALTAILGGSGAPVSAAQKAQLIQVGAAVKTATGSISYDSKTHLPSAFQASIKAVLPAKLATKADGITGLDLAVSAHFSDWGRAFTVTAPTGATPLQLGGVTSVPQGSSTYSG